MRDGAINDAPIGDGPVVYWMTAQRRMQANHALVHAAERARALGRGLVVVEALRPDYPHAAPRFHAFVRQGMLDNQRAADAMGIDYIPVIEQQSGGHLLADVAAQAALIVMDDHPGFFYPRMLEAAARIKRRVEAVDGVGIMPLVAGKAFVSAYQFRRFLHKELLPHLMDPPGDPGDVASGSLDLGPCLDMPALDGPPATDRVGGSEAAQERLDAFDVTRYLDRNHPDAAAESGLSPYLHFGHIGAHQVVQEILAREDWEPSRIGKATGQRSGWWGLSEEAEAFLDQIITWRELGHMEARHNPRYMEYDSLPEWARETLAKHDGDRSAVYDLDTLEAAATDDPLWNAAQRQLLEEGIIHNYMRMLWGKKILEWAPTARTALDWMLLLNDRYALDGRDPNSVSGIFWCLGRYDRAWQERDVYGKVRCMTSASTRRKLRLDAYLDRWS